MTDTELISKLRAENAYLNQKVTLLENKLLLLLEQLQKQGVKKDSHNSSLPPSSDLVTKNKSLRPVSNKPSGGQIGHEGTSLEISSTPDKIIDLKAEFCSFCGLSLSKASFVLKTTRQVIELPPITPIYEEYRQYGCQCPNCQHEQKGVFPLGVNAPIQYGSSVESLVSYLSVYQYLPFKRLKNFFAQVFSLPLSEGSIDNILERSALKCDGFYQYIKQQIALYPIVGSDETSAKVNGAKWWLWVWQNIQNTFIVASDNRGSATVDSVWENGLPLSTLVSDRYAAQMKINRETNSHNGHQICLAHLLRDVIFLQESEKHPFATQFKDLLVSIFDHRKTMLLLNQAYLIDSPQALALEKRLNQLLLMTIDKEKQHNTANFQRSMLKYRNYLLPCLYNLQIPPDNNASERAIRNVKVKQKVSGQFKTGQNAFCVIRSVIDTLLKRKVELLPALKLIIKTQPAWA